MKIFITFEKLNPAKPQGFLLTYFVNSNVQWII